MINCEELQFDLPLYFDGSLNSEERARVDTHLPTCPLCRQKLSEFEELSADLKSVSRISPPQTLVESIRSAVARQLAPVGASPAFHLLDRPRSWKEIWLMPSMISSAATLIVGFTLLSYLLAPPPVPLLSRNVPDASERTQLLLPSNFDLSPDEYAKTRLSIAGESPSINPRGALVALTKSLVRGEMKDDEVVVVADVFGNGVARIAEVVEPSHDERAVRELQKALQSDPSYAPFVPANMDGRSETMRVVLRIQNVDVPTHTK